MERYIHRITRLVVTPKTADWCKMPYPGHAKGCPNQWNEKALKCPPRAPRVDEYFDISRPLFFVNSQFRLKQHFLRMRREHPDWTEKQRRCVLYWQNTSRAQMRVRYRAFMIEQGMDAVTECPEGMGVNVYATAALSGLHLQPIKELSICRHVALVGWRKHDSSI